MTTDKICQKLRENKHGLSITELTAALNISRSAVRTQLAQLEGAEKVTVRKVGMAKVYILNQESDIRDIKTAQTIPENPQKNNTGASIILSILFMFLLIVSVNAKNITINETINITIENITNNQTIINETIIIIDNTTINETIIIIDNTTINETIIIIDNTTINETINETITENNLQKNIEPQLSIMTEPCTPEWTCEEYAVCNINDEQTCNTVTDNNNCGETYSGDLSEFIEACEFYTRYRILYDDATEDNIATKFDDEGYPGWYFETDEYISGPINYGNKYYLINRKPGTPFVTPIIYGMNAIIDIRIRNDYASLLLGEGGVYMPDPWQMQSVTGYSWGLSGLYYTNNASVAILINSLSILEGISEGYHNVSMYITKKDMLIISVDGEDIITENVSEYYTPTNNTVYGFYSKTYSDMYHAEVHVKEIYDIIYDHPGLGSQEDPYIITTLSQFEQMQNSSGYFILGNDLDISSINTLTYNPELVSFDGQGFTLYNINKNIFELISGNISNLQIECTNQEFNISEYEMPYFGLLTNKAEGSYISNINITCDTPMDYSGSGFTHFGSIAGYIGNETVIVNSSFSGEFTIHNDIDTIIGGLVGLIDEDSSIINSTTYGVVKGFNDYYNKAYIGSITGHNDGTIYNSQSYMIIKTPNINTTSSGEELASSGTGEIINSEFYGVVQYYGAMSGCQEIIYSGEYWLNNNLTATDTYLGTCFYIHTLDELDFDCHNVTISHESLNVFRSESGEYLGNITIKNCDFESVSTSENAIYFSSEIDILTIINTSSDCNILNSTGEVSSINMDDIIINSTEYNEECTGIAIESANNDMIIDISEAYFNNIMTGIDLHLITLGNSVINITNNHIENSYNGIIIENFANLEIYNSEITANNSLILNNSVTNIYLYNNSFNYEITGRTFYQISSNNTINPNSSMNKGWFPALNTLSWNGVMETHYYDGDFYNGLNPDLSQNDTTHYYPNNNGWGIKNCMSLDYGNIYVLSNDLYALEDDCLIANTNNITIDCRGFSIIGDNTEEKSGIYSNKNYTIIKNCNIEDFYYGINFESNTNNTIRDSVIENTNDEWVVYPSSAIRLGGSSYNNITNISAHTHNGGYVTIQIHKSSNYNTITNSIIISDTIETFEVGAIHIGSSRYNTIINNTINASLNGVGVRIATNQDSSNDYNRFIENRIYSFNGSAINLYKTNANTFLNNTIQSNMWVIDNSLTGNKYNNSVMGNSWKFLNGTAASSVYDITSSTDDWADDGTDIPFSTENIDEWAGLGEDWHPFVCSSDWYCSEYGECNINDTKTCSEVTDRNNCGDPYEENISEITTTCDYCTPNWTCQQYTACASNGYKECTSIIDNNTCSEEFTGDIDNYTITCTYNSPSTSSGGGSGGGSFSGITTCTPSWQCEEWSECSPEGISTRTCADKNDCGTETNIPPTEQKCNYNDKKDKTIENPSDINSNKDKEKALFDIILEVLSDSENNNRDLSIKITLINFGKPGIVDTNVTYTITDSKGVIVYQETRNVSVDTQKQFIDHIDASALKDGEYTLSAALYYPGQLYPAKSEKKIYIGDALFQKNIQNMIIVLATLLAVVGIFFGYKHLRLYKYKKKAAETLSNPQNIMKQNEVADGVKNTAKEEAVSTKEETNSEETVTTKKEAQTVNVTDKVVEETPSETKIAEIECPEDKGFIIGTRKIRTVNELIDNIIMMDEATFHNYANEQKNDFSNWIKDVFSRKDIADHIRKMFNKNEVIRQLRRYV